MEGDLDGLFRDLFADPPRSPTSSPQRKKNRPNKLTNSTLKAKKRERDRLRQQNKSEELQKLKEYAAMSYEDQQTRYVQLAEERSSRASAAAAQAQESSLVKRKEKALTQKQQKINNLQVDLSDSRKDSEAWSAKARAAQEKLQVERALAVSSKTSIRETNQMLEKREKKVGRTEKIQARLERQLEQRESKLPSFDKQVQELQEVEERVEQRLMTQFTAAVRTEAKSLEKEKMDLTL
jgi:hypothetical protein